MTAKPRVLHVEDQPCPDAPDVNHQLRNTTVRGRARTACVWCGDEWATLDEALREER